MTPFRSEALDNGLVVEFFDLSNRYFGDYHRVCVEVRLQISRPDYENPLVKVQILQRMGVPGAEIETVRDRLAQDYWRHAGRYLAHADYPARLVAAQAGSPHRRTTIGCRPDVA